MHTCTPPYSSLLLIGSFCDFYIFQQALIELWNSMVIFIPMQNIRKCYRVIAVPLFQDNYSYVIQGTAANKLVLVDPANPPVVLSFLRSNFPNHAVSHVLYTHKHWDHAGESLDLYKELKNSNPNVRIVIGEHDRNFVEGANYSLSVDEELEIGKARVKTLHVPCHTKGHTVYSFLPQEESEEDEESRQIEGATIEGKNIIVFHSESCTFTGDTLFIGGIGRFFEGNAGQMVQNIRKIYERVSHQSHIFCGHEYTIANLRWAAQVEKENKPLTQKLAELENKFALNPKICTLPSTLQQEKQINIFVRAVTGTPLLTRLNVDSIQLMRLLREMKNSNKIELPSL